VQDVELSGHVSELALHRADNATSPSNINTNKAEFAVDKA
jgi:hypothetical protein